MIARKITAMATVALLTSLTVAGCSNDINEPMVELEHSKNLLSKEVLSTEELLKTGVDDVSSYQTSEDVLQTRAVSLTHFTIYGCTSQKGGGNYKYLIPDEISNALRIAKGIYIAENVTCSTEIKIDGLGTSIVFSPATSPMCGLMPGGSNFARGYTCTNPDSEGKVIFSTSLIHIICDISGRNYNMWYPCKPENIEWKYNLVQ